MLETSQHKAFMLLHKAAMLVHRGHHHGPEHGRRGHPGQMRVLSLLSRMDGAGQSEIAERLDIRPASLSELIGRLETAGLAERRQSGEDKRLVHVFLTEEGKRMAGEAMNHRESMMKDMFTQLTEEECGQLVGLLEKLTNGMEQSMPCGRRCEGEHGDCGGERHGGHGRHRHHHHQRGCHGGPGPGHDHDHDHGHTHEHPTQECRGHGHPHPMRESCRGHGHPHPAHDGCDCGHSHPTRERHHGEEDHA